MYKYLDSSKTFFATNSRSLLTNFLKHIINQTNRDEIIIPSFCCEAVFLASYFSGGKTILVDCNKENFSVSIKDLKKLINPNTSAILIPHMFGSVAYTELLLGLYKENESIIWIDDPCQTYLTKYKDDKYIGELFDFSIYSFNPSKPLNGNISLLAKTTNNKFKESIFHSFKDIFNYKNTHKKNNEIMRIQSSYFISKIGAYRNLGYPINLDYKLIKKIYPLYSDINNPDSEDLENAIETLKNSQKYEYPYNSYFNYQFSKKLPDNNFYRKYKMKNHDRLWRYPLLLNDHNDVNSLSYNLRKKGISVSNHYFSLSYLFPKKTQDCKQSEELCESILNLWFNSNEEVNTAINLISEYFKNKE